MVQVLLNMLKAHAAAYKAMKEVCLVVAPCWLQKQRPMLSKYADFEFRSQCLSSDSQL